MAEPLVVRVADDRDRPFVGASVEWSIDRGTGALSAERTATGPDGTAFVDLVLGEDAGQRTIVARLDESLSATFAATGVPLGAERLEKGDHDLQDLGAGSTTAVSVRVSDRFSNPVTGATVRWTVASGAGSLSDSARVTDAISLSDDDGMASATWIMGEGGTLNELDALIEGSGVSVRFSTTTKPSTTIVDTSDPGFGGLDPPPVGSPGTDASAIAMTIGGTVSDRSVLASATISVRVDGTDAAGNGFNGTCEATDHLLDTAAGEIDRNSVDITNGSNSIRFKETFTIAEPPGAVNPVGYCFEVAATDAARSKTGAPQGNSATLFTIAFVTWNP